MIFGLGAATIFYFTTGQFFHDVKSALGDTCCSRSVPDYEEISDLIFDEDGAMGESSERSSILNGRKPSYGS